MTTGPSHEISEHRRSRWRTRGQPAGGKGLRKRHSGRPDPKLPGGAN